jgi:hypothetical protein
MRSETVWMKAKLIFVTCCLALFSVRTPQPMLLLA